jgi:hypothetical protein
MSQYGVSAPGQMRVFDSFSRAYRHSKRMFFEPFEFGKWIQMGVILFLAVLFQGGGMNFGSSLPSGGSGGSGGSGDLGGAGDWLRENLVLVVGLAAVAVAVVLVFFVLFTWLTSRGTVMLIRAVAENDSDIGANWRASKPAGSRLFWFRLLLAAVMLAVALVVLAGMGFTLAGVGFRFDDGWGIVLSVLPWVLVAAPVWIGFWLVNSLTVTFVAPLMYKHEVGVRAGWGMFREAARGNGLAIAGYYGVYWLVSMLVGVAVFLVTCATCCMGALPVIHHTLFAPVYAFQWTVALYMLGDAGDRYAVVRPERLFPEQYPEAPPPPPAGP